MNFEQNGNKPPDFQAQIALLKDNGLILRHIPLEQNSLMKCISDSLYLTTKYEMALYNVCQLYLVKLCREKQILP